MTSSSPLYLYLISYGGRGPAYQAPCWRVGPWQLPGLLRWSIPAQVLFFADPLLTHSVRIAIKPKNIARRTFHQIRNAGVYAFSEEGDALAFVPVRY